MKKEQAYLVLFIFLLLVSIILLDFTKPIISGKIQKVKFYPDHTSIYLENNSPQIYLTNKSPVQLKKEMNIQIFGKEENYLNASIIFADKIVCTNC
jgi:hypothetical protein